MFLTEAIGVYFGYFGVSMFMAIDSLFFYVERYDIDKPTLVKFFNSFLVFSLISKVIDVTRLVNSIAGWYFSEPYGFGKSRTGWLFLNLFWVSIYFFLSIKQSISEGSVEMLEATILLLIVIAYTTFLTYRFGSKLEKFENK